MVIHSIAGLRWNLFKNVGYCLLLTSGALCTSVKINQEYTGANYTFLHKL